MIVPHLIMESKVLSKFRFALDWTHRWWSLVRRPFQRWASMDMDRRNNSSNWTPSSPGIWVANEVSLKFNYIWLQLLLLTPKEKIKNLDKRLGLSKQAPVAISFQMNLPSSLINASLSQDLKSSILFLLTIAPWHWYTFDRELNSLCKKKNEKNKQWICFFFFKIIQIAWNEFTQQTGWKKWHQFRGNISLHQNWSKRHLLFCAHHSIDPHRFSVRLIYAKMLDSQTKWMAGTGRFFVRSWCFTNFGH